MLSRIGPVIALAVLLALAIAFVTRVEAHGFCLFCSGTVHRAPPTRPFDPNFCIGVIKAFDTLHPKDLDTFIFSIPEMKREQARRCMTDRK